MDKLDTLIETIASHRFRFCTNGSNGPPVVFRHGGEANADAGV
jgi:hypothetical protein